MATAKAIIQLNEFPLSELALTHYYHALLHLRSIGGHQPEQQIKEESDKQLVMVYNNIAGKRGAVGKK